MVIKQRYITAFEVGIRCCKRLRFNCMRTIFFILLILTVQLSFSQGAKVYRLPDIHSKLIIPFENHNNLIIIPVKLNRIFKTKFILDSGARNTVLIESYCRFAASRTVGKNYCAWCRDDGRGGCLSS